MEHGHGHVNNFIIVDPPRNISGMAEVRGFRFYASVAQAKCWPLSDKLSPMWTWSMSRDLLKFWQISVDISKTVQDRDTA